ncbi:hypothetical protein BJV82DRAFT_121655 [Fennellomyces sp. T-0311]|nr:hypothetical protein BJV82DRAFT_121655 [Fennellomyces sp. T-0311]
MSWTPQVGDVIYTVGDSKKEDVWDDTELIEHWEVAMEEYRAIQGQSKDTPPYGTSYNAEAAEERQQPKKRLRVAKDSKKKNVNSTGPSSAPNSVLQTQNQNDTEQDDFTRLLMSWYYAGYYTGYYQGQSR